MSRSKDVQDTRLVSAAVYSNSYKSIATNVDSTGFRTHSLRHRSLSVSNDMRAAETFLVNSRFSPIDRETQASIEGYFADPGVMLLSMAGKGERQFFDEMALPDGTALRMELGEAMINRRSVRMFANEPMELAHLASMVRVASAITAHAEVNLLTGGRATIDFRAAPSGGGLYPVDLYVAALNVEGLRRETYKYIPERDSLGRVTDAGLADVLNAFAVPEDVISLRRSSAVFLLIGRPWRSMRKYGSKGLRNLFLEAGAIAEHLNLAAVTLGLGSVDCAGVYDAQLHAALGFDGLYETFIHSLIVGHPS